MQKTTEQSSRYNNLENMSVYDLLSNINNEDKTVAYTIEKIIPKIEILVYKISERLKDGGRLFYIGAGTSGRLGVVDASECPPTFGVDPNVVIGIMAGGDKAIRNAVEFAEDDDEAAWNDLKKFNINYKDIIIGIAASGTTPYVVGALKKCKTNQIATACIVCNLDSPLAAVSDFPIECIVGPEFVTGSSRMKAGTAQKLILNMISTSVMIQLGHVKGNKMVDMQLSNYKLIARAENMIMEQTGCTRIKARVLLDKYGNVRSAIDQFEQ